MLHGDVQANTADTAAFNAVSPTKRTELLLDYQHAAANNFLWQELRDEADLCIQTLG